MTVAVHVQPKGNRFEAVAMRRHNQPDYQREEQPTGSLNVRSLAIAAVVLLGIGTVLVGPRMAEWLPLTGNGVSATVDDADRQSLVERDAEPEKDAIDESNENAPNVSEEGADEPRTVVLKPSVLPNTELARERSATPTTASFVTREQVDELVESQLKTELDSVYGVLDKLRGSIRNNAKAISTVETSPNTPIVSDDSVTFDQVTKEVETLRQYVERELGTLRSQIDAQEAALRDSVSDPTNTEPTVSVDQLRQVRTELLQALARVERDLSTLKKTSTSNDDFARRQLQSLRQELNGPNKVARRETKRPINDSGWRSGAKPASSGLLVIDNDSGREQNVIINGQRATLQRGRNSFRVPVRDVEVSIPSGDKSWKLERSLWERVGDEMVLHRKHWPI